MSTSTLKKAKVTIKYHQALTAISIINPLKRVGEGENMQLVPIKSDLSSAKGSVGTHTYQFKHDIKDACKALDELSEDKWKEIRELNEEKKKLTLTEDGDPIKKLSKESEERVAEINDEIQELQKELNELNEDEIEVTLKRGKFNIKDVEKYLDADEIEGLDFAIKF